jgi:site-specific DNA-cytosine methylase
LCADIGTLTARDIINLCNGIPDVIWASPDCTTYSVAAISKHRKRDLNGNLYPISEYAKKCDEYNRHLISLIKELNPRYWFIENPRAGMRKMDFMQSLPRYTVTYCQYGEKRMKPTDIWTNHPEPNFKPPCKNGDSCHEPAPRGATTGTQGIHSKIDKARIPKELCEHIVDICEKVIKYPIG